MKTCTQCGQTFPATTDYFHRQAHRSDGLHSHCKTCRNPHARAYMRLHHAGKRRPRKPVYDAVPYIDLYEFICAEINGGRVPTLQIMARHFDVSYLAIHWRVHRLIEWGYLTKGYARHGFKQGPPPLALQPTDKPISDLDGN